MGQGCPCSAQGMRVWCGLRGWEECKQPLSRQKANQPTRGPQLPTRLARRLVELEDVKVPTPQEVLQKLPRKRYTKAQLSGPNGSFLEGWVALKLESVLEWAHVHIRLASLLGHARAPHNTHHAAQHCLSRNCSCWLHVGQSLEQSLLSPCTLQTLCHLHGGLRGGRGAVPPAMPPRVPCAMHRAGVFVCACRGWCIRHGMGTRVARGMLLSLVWPSAEAPLHTAGLPDLAPCLPPAVAWALFQTVSCLQGQCHWQLKDVEQRRPRPSLRVSS